MRKGRAKSLMFKSGVVALACALSVCAYAMADTPKAIDVPAGDLAQALKLISKQAGVELVFRPEQLKGLRTKGVSGNFSSQEAVKKLLEGTSLQLRTDEATGAMMIGASDINRRVPDTTRLDVHGEGGSTDEAANPTGPRSQSSLSDRFRLAQADQATSSSGGRPVSSNGGTESVQLDEIVVTAQKREQRLQDVPVPVSVLSGDNLAQNNQVLLREYYETVPGLDFTPNFGANADIVIRGVGASAFEIPTVAVLVDDVPYSTTISVHAPDIDPGDLERIEVLRGPQGTLYGASSLGGIIKYVTRDPSTADFDGRVEAGISSVHNGAEPGYNARASVNVPVTSTFAFRASVFKREEAGYIDDVLTGKDGVNETRSEGGRFSALWKPTDDFSLKLSALYQSTKSDGATEVIVKPGLGDLQNDALPGVGGYDHKAESYSAIVKYLFNGITLTSTTGFSINHLTDSEDLSSLFGLPPPSGVWLRTPVDEQKFSQEVRFAGTIGPQFDWLAGGFFTHELQVAANNNFGIENGLTGEFEGYLFGAPAVPTHQTYREYAGFFDLTYHVTDRFDLQAGLRESNILNTSWTGASATLDAKANALTYLFTPQYRFTEDLMVYARVASGFRPGQVNTAAAIAAGAPAGSDPDKTYNYELGLKGDFFERVLSIDTSLYYIDWKDLQIQLTTPAPFVPYFANGGRAKSTGVEFSATVRPWTGMTATGWGSYNKAVLAEAFPANSSIPEPSGARLPFSAKWSGHVSLEQAFPLSNDVKGFVGVQVSYVGDRANVFAANIPQGIFPAYTKTDLSARVEYQSWTFSTYVNNVADVRGLLNGPIANYLEPNVRIYIQPRTFGFNVAKTL